MVDTWATVSRPAPRSAPNVHLSGGVGIGGVLEPPNARPVVIEDDAFIGSRSIIVEGARVGRGAVLGAASVLNPSIPVIDAETGEEISRGYVPDYCVAVPATRPRESPGGTFHLTCMLVIRRMEGRTSRQGQVRMPFCAITASRREPARRDRSVNRSSVDLAQRRRTGGAGRE
jgi:2,3,4,5-tetrahydropyridine-2-carboxylate N-succinyltransferase